MPTRLGLYGGPRGDGDTTGKSSVTLAIATRRSAILLMSGDSVFAGIRTVSKTLTVDTALMAAEDLIADKVTIAGSEISRSGRASILQSLTIFDASDQAAALGIILFKSDPTNTTFTKNAAFSIHANDEAKVCGLIKVAATDYFATSAKQMACIQNLAIPIQLSDEEKLYAAVVSAGTPTYAAADDLRLHFGFMGG